jgi:hypothetical protein
MTQAEMIAANRTRWWVVATRPGKQPAPISSYVHEGEPLHQMQYVVLADCGWTLEVRYGAELFKA